MEKDVKNCGMHKVIMGVGVIIFSLVLYITSSDASLTSNLNWPGAFFVIGVLLVIKGLVVRFLKK